MLVYHLGQILPMMQVQGNDWHELPQQQLLLQNVHQIAGSMLHYAGPKGASALGTDGPDVPTSCIPSLPASLLASAIRPIIPAPSKPRAHTYHKPRRLSSRAACLPFVSVIARYCTLSRRSDNLTHKCLEMSFCDCGTTSADSDVLGSLLAC